MILIFGFILLFYSALIISLRIGWNKIPKTAPSLNVEKTTFSVLVPFRNEAENLLPLLKSISELNYSLDYFEVILIDDGSNDSSVKVIRNFSKSHSELSLTILQNQRQTPAPKKDAIATGVKNAKMDYILTTDADCEVQKNWLQEFNCIIQNQNPSLIAGPVIFKGQKKGPSFLEIFQDLDFISLQATGAGAFGLKVPFLCNGANLCYKKCDFLEVKGFSGNETISSGDDVFLLEKFVENNKKVCFLKNKEATVFTIYQPNIHSLLQQRIRWASKTPAYSGVFSKFTGIIVFFMNFILVLGIFLVLIREISAAIPVLAFLIKFFIDLLLLYPASKFFNKTTILKSYWYCSLVYPFFIFLTAVLAIFGSYNWKGRKFKT